MTEWDLRLLEHTAIRNVTRIDYKVWQDLKQHGVMKENSFPDMRDITYLSDNADEFMLSGRTMELLDDAVKCSDKVKLARDKYAKLVEENGIGMVSKGDGNYPAILDHLSGMPPILFYKGDVRIFRKLDINGGASIVGSRNPGRYALYATGEFSQYLSEKQVVVVSGMALGIDRKAHEACLDSLGKTIAVVPGGCDVIYPYQNVDVYERICESGVVVSEMPPGQEVIKQYFPSRNRLISALSDVCLIMEAGEHSGTLHTASFAAVQSRDVFVLPNSIYAENSIGGLKLLRDGAEVLIDKETVYERIMEQSEYRREELDGVQVSSINSLRDKMRSRPEELREDEWKDIICDEISEKPKNIDDLCISLGIPFSYLSALVTGLETEGRIANERGKYVLTIHGR